MSAPPAPDEPAAATAAAAAAAASARRSYGKLIAWLSARTRDVAAAEDALSEAFAAALADWPRVGVPEAPDAWLLTVARRRLIDAHRQRRQQEGAADTLALLMDEAVDGAPDSAGHREIPDDRLALLFACAHPAIDAGVRAPLMLQTILGFDAVAIGSAFLVAPATMGQRLVRAKARIRQAGVPFRVPALSDLATPDGAERLQAVLDAIYACYAEGWTDPAGTDAHRRNLADEALWLGGLLASLMPEVPEALGLLALMLHSHARRHARRDALGRYVPLAEHDTTQWDHTMIREAERLLHRASALALGGPGGGAHRVGRYQLEAAVQSAHAVRRLSGQADWPAIERLYAALARLTDSPVVVVNQAVALAETQGPAAALALLDSVGGDARLADYQPWWAARAEVLMRLGRNTDAQAAGQRAIGLAVDPAVRTFLQRRFA